MPGIDPDRVPGIVARVAVSQLVSQLIEYMLKAGEDPTDDALWQRRKAEALSALQAELARLPGQLGPDVLSPAERARLARVRKDLQASPCRVSGGERQCPGRRDKSGQAITQRGRTPVSMWGPSRSFDLSAAGASFVCQYQ